MLVKVVSIFLLTIRKYVLVIFKTERIEVLAEEAKEAIEKVEFKYKWRKAKKLLKEYGLNKNAIQEYKKLVKPK